MFTKAIFFALALILLVRAAPLEICPPGVTVTVYLPGPTITLTKTLPPSSSSSHTTPSISSSHPSSVSPVASNHPSSSPVVTITKQTPPVPSNSSTTLTPSSSSSSQGPKPTPTSIPTPISDPTPVSSPTSPYGGSPGGVGGQGAGEGGQSSGGDLQLCCNKSGDANSFVVTLLAGLLGLDLSERTGLIGVGCTLLGEGHLGKCHGSLIHCGSLSALGLGSNCSF